MCQSVFVVDVTMSAPLVFFVPFMVGVVDLGSRPRAMCLQPLGWLSAW